MKKSTLLIQLMVAAALSMGVPMRDISAQDSLSRERDATNPSAAGMVAGTDAARQVRTTGWFVGGLATGLVTNLLGTTIIVVVAGTPDVPMPADSVARSGEYQKAFEAGYTRKVKSKRRVAALRGGLIGSVVFTVVYLVGCRDGC